MDTACGLVNATYTETLTVYDYMYEGAPCAWSIGKPFEGNGSFLCPTDGLGLYRRPCTSLDGILYIVYVQAEPSRPIVLNMPTILQTLGLQGLQVVIELQVVLYRGTPAPVSLSFLPSLTHVKGALSIQEAAATVSCPVRKPHS